MQRDREVICEIISTMLDNPDKVGIYPTSTAYSRLEIYMESIRLEAIGWMHAYACTLLDEGGDPRIVVVDDMLRQARKDLKI